MLTATGAAFTAPGIRDRQQQDELLQKAFGEFAATVQRNRPFYADEVFKATAPISQFTTEALIKAGVGPKEYAKWAASQLQVIIDHQIDVEKAIRKRMQVIGIS